MWADRHWGPVEWWVVVVVTRAGLFLSTDMVEPALRTDAWRDITRPFFETSQVDENRQCPLQGSLHSQALGSLLIGPTSFNRQQYRRDRRIIVQGGLDQYLIQLFLNGSIAGNCDGVDIAAGPGDIVVFDLSRPFASQVEPGNTLTVLLPRMRVDAAARGRSLHGTVLKAGSAVTRLLSDVLVGLSRVANDLSGAQLFEIEATATSLLASCIAQSDVGEVVSVALAPTLRHSMLCFIDDNLPNPELGPALLMVRFRLSRAHLYRVFAADGGVATVIRERRLDAAYRLLISSNNAEQSITQVAYAYGFSSSSQFQRAFRGQFGVSPREARQGDAIPMLADQRLMVLHTEFVAYSQQIAAKRS
jgi:AraC-like DNA-binding protein